MLSILGQISISWQIRDMMHRWHHQRRLFNLRHQVEQPQTANLASKWILTKVLALQGARFLIWELVDMYHLPISIIKWEVMPAAIWCQLETSSQKMMSKQQKHNPSRAQLIWVSMKEDMFLEAMQMKVRCGLKGVQRWVLTTLKWVGKLELLL